MASLPTEIQIPGYRGGGFSVSREGVSVFTDHCGCGSEELRDRDKIEELRDALDVWLALNPRTVTPTE